MTPDEAYDEACNFIKSLSTIRLRGGNQNSWNLEERAMALGLRAQGMPVDDVGSRITGSEWSGKTVRKLEARTRKAK